ncbi:hypothetical protein J2T13_003045 [Paenibacillus sp. DS2015]|uniref:acetyl-CoA acetyltransferase n=1 Tax=Paenibacillus sp. DS2015 TaxID=3373917 RepID=UPI003D2341AE
MTIVPPSLLTPTPQVIYQADPHTIQTLRHKRDRVHQMAHQYMNHNIRVQTVDGHIYQGLLANLDGAHLYLNVSGNPHMNRQLYNPYNNVILPLVLYELLVITLLL